MTERGPDTIARTKDGVILDVPELTELQDGLELLQYDYPRPLLPTVHTTYGTFTRTNTSI